MPHMVFFSYARKDLDRYLEDFFKDLSWEISLLTEYSAEDDELSFRDKSSLPLMENWNTSCGIFIKFGKSVGTHTTGKTTGRETWSSFNPCRRL
jgi:hypothetical protein